jgi:NADH-quinone oxidoreductase subunit L
MFDLADNPGRLFVWAAALPLATAVVLAVAGAVRNHLAPAARFPRLSAALMLTAFVAAAGCAAVGLVRFLRQPAGTAWAERAEWLRVGSPRPTLPASTLGVGYHVDALSALMIAMVALIGSLIVLFSVGYLNEERGTVHDHVARVHRRGRFGRFVLYLGLFAASMLNLLLADNLLQVFVGWELVGACSYFLIGFYSERPAAVAAATKAFVVNRVGDAGLLVGIAAAWQQFGTLHIPELIRLSAGAGDPGLTPLGLGLFVGCVGKSAQVPLHTWLPDAMEGPTPVSALIHAATMVAAGVYLVGRCFPLLTPDVLTVITYTGLVTAVVAATVACVQTDIKRVLAYSTMSQLGFMMLALGVGGWAAGLFHLLTHAFFKALLFLCAGSAIHALHHEQDLRQMGGLRRRLPVTAYAMLVGVLAIGGVPLLSGWYSKEAVLTAVADGPSAAVFGVAVFTAGLTAYYMLRLWLLAFAGEPRSEAADHTHESPAVMTLPLVVLAVFSVGLGWGWPIWVADASELGRLLHAADPTPRPEVGHHHITHEQVAGLALTATAVGFAAAVGLRRWATAVRVPPLDRKWYFDDLYAAALVGPTRRLAEVAAGRDRRPPSTPRDRLDPGTVDGLLAASAVAAAVAGSALRRAQAGRPRGYVLALGLTVAAALGMLVAWN